MKIDKDILKGLKIGFGFILVISFFGLVAAGWHPASQIIAGIFLGNFTFNGTTIFEGGNVGIGTTNPTSTLDVVGDFKLNDAYRIQTHTGGVMQNILITGGGGVAGGRILVSDWDCGSVCSSYREYIFGYNSYRTATNTVWNWQQIGSIMSNGPISGAPSLYITPDNKTLVIPIGTSYNGGNRRSMAVTLILNTGVKMTFS